MKKTFLLTFLLLLIFASSKAEASLEKDVLAELNLARTKPQAYAQFLREYRKLYRGNYVIVSRNMRMASAEGVSAVDEAIRFLSKQNPLSPLSPSKGLSEAAHDLVGDQSATGDTGHQGSRSGGMDRRIERHGDWQRSIGENISYGFDNARSVVMQLIIDDGIRGRGHRKNIFNPGFKTAGVACGTHPEFRYMCVIDFAGGFSR